jgi:hypothetical protein
MEIAERFCNGNHTLTAPLIKVELNPHQDSVPRYN